jgi:hypothetical protein
MNNALRRSERRVNCAQKKTAPARGQGGDPAGVIVTRADFENWARLLIDARVRQSAPLRPTTKVRP